MSERLPVVCLDQDEAVELSELCWLLAGWLTRADAAVERSLERYVGVDGYRFELRDDLVRWSELLVHRDVAT